MEKKVERYQRTVLAKHDRNSNNEQDETSHGGLQQLFENFAGGQNHLGRAMAVALFKGMQVSKQRQEQTPTTRGNGDKHDGEEANKARMIHARELRVLKEAHARELRVLNEAHQKEQRELREQLEAVNAATTANTKARATNSGVVTNITNASRNEAFRQRWKNRISSKNNNNNNNNNHTALHSGDDNQSANGAGTTAAGTEVASTVVSNMSCRELSVERYRAKILQQMNRGKGTTASTRVTGRSPSSVALARRLDTSDKDSGVTDNNNDNDDDDDATTGSSGNSNNAVEIQRLLDELQQAERRQKLLEKQLQQAGVVLAEDIPYQLAKDKVASISKRMNEIGSSEVVHSDPLVQKQLREEYFRLEKDMQKYLSALMLTDEYAQERRAEEDAWEARHLVANQEALEAIRGHMPVDVRTLTPSQLETERGLSKPMVQRFRRINVLQLLRVDPEVVAKWHPSALEALRVTGLTLTERRALHSYLLPVVCKWNGNQQQNFIGGSGGDSMTKRKLAWYNAVRTNFKEALNSYERHVNASSTPRPLCLHGGKCNLIGNQCPVRVDRSVDYFRAGPGCGFPRGRVYEDPVALIAKDDRPAKSPAQIIAEARGGGAANPETVQGGGIASTATKECQHPAVPAAATKKPRHPLAMVPKTRGSAAPNGLLAAIAARRID